MVPGKQSLLWVADSHSADVYLKESGMSTEAGCCCCCLVTQSWAALQEANVSVEDLTYQTEDAMETGLI